MSMVLFNKTIFLAVVLRENIFLMEHIPFLTEGDDIESIFVSNYFIVT